MSDLVDDDVQGQLEACWCALALTDGDSLGREDEPCPRVLPCMNHCRITYIKRRCTAATSQTIVLRDTDLDV